MGQDVPLTDRCCGDAGSFAYSRPDIATQVKFRKQQEIEKGAEKLRADGFTGDVKILTSCPACLQGLSRYDDDAGTKADYIVVELAKHLLGENWAAQYVEAPTTAASSASCSDFRKTLRDRSRNRCTRARKRLQYFYAGAILVTLSNDERGNGRQDLRTVCHDRWNPALGMPDLSRGACR
jgi:hypothetical protein